MSELFDKDEKKDEAAQPTESDGDRANESILHFFSKCRGWFEKGVAMGAAGLGTSYEESRLPPPPPRVIDTVRALAETMAGVLEIPFLAARLYWEELSTPAREPTNEVLTTQPIPDTAIASYQTATIEVGSAVVYPFRMLKLRLFGDDAKLCIVRDIRVGKYSQFFSTGISGEFAVGDGLSIEAFEVTGPGRSLTLEVENPGHKELKIRGVVVGLESR